MSDDINPIHKKIRDELYFILREDNDDLYRHEFVTTMCVKFKITKSLVYKEIEKAIDSGDIEYFKPYRLPFARAKAMRMVTEPERPKIIKL
jgi:hypothetical protein